MAWLSACLVRIDPKKFPKLDKLLVQAEPAPRRFQDPEARWLALSGVASNRQH